MVASDSGDSAAISSSQVRADLLYLGVINSHATSIGCRAARPAPSWIWCRQLVPGATITASAGALRTIGNNAISPIRIDSS